MSDGPHPRVAIGPLKTELIPSMENFIIIVDVLFCFQDSLLMPLTWCFPKEFMKPHMELRDNRGVFARVIGGKRTIMKLTDDDEVLKANQSWNGKAL